MRKHRKCQHHVAWWQPKRREHNWWPNPRTCSMCGAVFADGEWRSVAQRTPPPSQAPIGSRPVAWTGSGSLAAIDAGLEGHIWPTRADSHPIPLFTTPQQEDSGA